LAVAAVTAAIVFGIGQQLFPVKPKQPPAPPPSVPAPVAPTLPSPEPKPASDGAATVAAPPAIEAGAVAAKVADAGTTSTAAPEKKEEAAGSEKAEKPTAPAVDEAAGDDGKPIDKQRQADKELAREAWRRNRPDVSVNGSKTAILVPIRGSIKGAEFKIVDKRRKVVVTLPKAVSMVTMRLYSLKHPSFKKVWIDQDEANAQPADGTKLRFVLSQSFDPQVEITDDFVRVTIRRPEPSDDARPDKHVDRPEKHGDRAEKHGDRAEKRSEPSSDDAATPADKSGD